MTNIINQRVQWIDFLKGFLLTCICLSHFGNLPYFLKYIIYPTGSIYVPTFFMLSGILYNDVKYPLYKDFLLSKIYSLFIPYIFFFFLFILFDWNMYIHTYKAFFQYSKALYFADGPPKASPIWFIIKLFLINQLYYFIVHFFIKPICIFIVIFLCSLIGYFLYYLNIHLPLGFEVIFSATLFFGLGNLGKNILFKILSYFNKIPITFIFITFALFIFVSYVSNQYNQFSVLSLNKIQNYFLFYFSSIIGCLALFILSYIIGEQFINKYVFKKISFFFIFLSRNALPILGTHVYIIIIIDQILNKVNIFDSITAFLVKIICLIIITYFFIIPFLYDKFYFIFRKENLNYNPK